jgi:hypothetical protein
MKPMKKYQFMADLACIVGCSIDHLYRHRRGENNVSKKLAKSLSEETGILWVKWIHPLEFGSPWDELFPMRIKIKRRDCKFLNEQELENGVRKLANIQNCKRKIAERQSPVDLQPICSAG